jgi:hypothetical protein
VTGPAPDPVAGTVADPPRPAGWSSHQLRTLAALSSAFAPGFAPADYARWAHEAAGTLNAVADPGCGSCASW